MAKKEKKKKVKPEGGGKKGKKLLLIPLILVLVAALAAAAIFFVLPHFGIHLLGGGEDEVDTPVDEPPDPGLVAYVMGKDSAASLDSILEEGEGLLLAERAMMEEKLEDPGEDGEDKSAEESPDSSGDSSEEAGAQIPDRLYYFYELEDYAGVINRYLDVLLGTNEGFSLVDEEYWAVDNRPELQSSGGSVTLAKASAQRGRLFQLDIGWSEENDNVAIRISTPEGAIQKAEPLNPPDQSASLEEHIGKLMSLQPSQLGLPGNSMEDYEVHAMVGFVKVDGIDCRRFTIYSRKNPGSIAGIYLISSGMDHFYQLDLESNMVTELR